MSTLIYIPKSYILMRMLISITLDFGMYEHVYEIPKSGNIITEGNISTNSLSGESINDILYQKSKNPV
jgi:hypothetical protein